MLPDGHVCRGKFRAYPSLLCSMCPPDDHHRNLNVHWDEKVVSLLAYIHYLEEWIEDTHLGNELPDWKRHRPGCMDEKEDVETIAAP